MSNTFIYEQGWLVEKPEMEKPMDHGQRLTYYQAELSSYQEHISTLRRFKYDYPDPGKEMELGKDFELVDSMKVFYKNNYPNGTKVAVPFNVYGENELLSDFDRGFLAGWEACKKEYQSSYPSPKENKL